MGRFSGNGLGLFGSSGSSDPSAGIFNGQFGSSGSLGPSAEMSRG